MISSNGSPTNATTPPTASGARPDPSRVDPARVARLEEVVAAVSRPLPDEASGTIPAVPGAPETSAAKPDIRDLYYRYQDELTHVTPHEVLTIFHRRLQSGLSASEILEDLGKALNLLFRGLKAYVWTRPPKDTFGDVLMQENAALLSRLEEIRALLKDGALDSDWVELGKRLDELEQFNAHYLKKENILFPYLERKADYFNGLAIMWTLHDQIRDQIRQIREQLRTGPAAARDDLANAIGHLFFAMHGLVYKEDYILLPAAMDTLTAAEWAEMAAQAAEYGYAFIPPPESPAVPAAPAAAAADSAISGTSAASEAPGTSAGAAGTAGAAGAAGAGETGALAGRFCTATGELDFEQLAAVFAALPIDLTVIDEHDKVRYFTRPKDRIFPRSPAIIGRDVRNCHPPESVGRVLEIVEAFRSGQRDAATFWIRLHGRLILIRYFSMRDAAGIYRGTLEVSQDLTDIQNLEGERRLAQWD